MFMTKIKSVLAMVLIVGIALACAAWLICQMQAGDQSKAKGEPPTANKDQKGEKERPTTKEEKLRVLIDKVLEAHGGEDKLNKLQFTMTVKYNNGATQKKFVQPPKNIRWETTHRDRTGKRIVILFPEGRRWWMKEPNEEPKEFMQTGIEPFGIEGWLDYVRFCGPRQVLRLKDADHKVVLLDEEAKIGDRPAVGVEVTGPHYNHKMYFDKETHLLLKSFGDQLREVTFTDYKKFDGIPIARNEDDGYFNPEVTDFRVVDKFDPKLFEQPQSEYRKQVRKKSLEKYKGSKPKQGDKAAGGESAVARSDNTLDGLWEDIENRGGWLRIQDSKFKYRPAGKSDEVIEWTCRYNLTVTPMTIDIFQKDGTAHGIFVVERGTLFIALAELGEERPTRFKRDEATTLFVLKRAAKGEDEATPTKEDTPKVNGTIHVHGILESVDAKKGTITVKGVSGDDAMSLKALLAVASGKKSVENYPKLVNVFVQPMQMAADGVIGIGAGDAKMKRLKMEDLKAGQVVMLQLTDDRTSGFVVTFVRVVSDGEEKKP